MKGGGGMSVGEIRIPTRIANDMAVARGRSPV